MQVNIPIAESRDPELGPLREMTDKDFDIIREAIGSQARQWLENDGEAPPTVFLPAMGPDGITRMGIMPAADLVNHPVGKDILAMLMSRLIEDPNHDFVVFAHEAWVLQADARSPGEVEKLREAVKESIAQHPQRKEALVINLRSKTRHAMCVMPIERAEDESIASIGEGELVFAGVNGASFEGRFAPPAPPSRPEGATLH